MRFTLTMPQVYLYCCYFWLLNYFELESTYCCFPLWQYHQVVYTYYSAYCVSINSRLGTPTIRKDRNVRLWHLYIITWMCIGFPMRCALVAVLGQKSRCAQWTWTTNSRGRNLIRFDVNDVKKILSPDCIHPPSSDIGISRRTLPGSSIVLRACMRWSRTKLNNIITLIIYNKMHIMYRLVRMSSVRQCDILLSRIDKIRKLICS